MIIVIIGYYIIWYPHRIWYQYNGVYKLPQLLRESKCLVTDEGPASWRHGRDYIINYMSRPHHLKPCPKITRLVFEVSARMVEGSTLDPGRPSDNTISWLILTHSVCLIWLAGQMQWLNYYYFLSALKCWSRQKKNILQHCKDVSNRTLLLYNANSFLNLG